MKYLKKFESNSSFYEDINMIFIEFVDEDLAYIYEEDDEDDCVGVEFILNSDNLLDIDSAVSATSKRLEVLEDIKVAINRVKDKFGDIMIKYNLDDVNNFIIRFYKPAPVDKSSFYIKRLNTIFLDEKSLKEILDLDDSVKVDIWSGSNKILKIKFNGKEQFLKHMYRDQRDLLQNSFRNETITDALIINPELMSQYWSLGKNFSKLKIDGIDIVTSIEDISIGQTKRYFGSQGEISKKEYSVDLILNDKFDYEF